MKDELLKISQQATASTAGRVLIELEPGYRYHNLLAQLYATSAQAYTASYAADTYLRVNGTIQRALLPSEIDAIQTINNPPSSTLGSFAAVPYSIHDNADTDPAILPWYFTEPWNPQFDAREAFALDLLPGDTASLEVGFVSSTAAPVVTAFADREPIGDVIASGRRLNRVDPRTGQYSTGPGSRPTLVKQFKFNSLPGAITHNITQLNRTFSHRDVIQHIRLTHPASRTIDLVEVSVNKTMVFKRTKFQNRKDLMSEGMTPSTGHFDWVPNASGDPRHGVEVGPSDDMNIALTFDQSASGNIAGIVQAFGPAN